MSNAIDCFGENVFSTSVMRERLPKAILKKMMCTLETGSDLDPAIADVVANAIKDWAIEKGATHYCHWFQPMTGATAEKHDSFLSTTGDGRAILEFSGKELSQGEPDASSFPSGGLRQTFEARGYTAWDCTSPVFIKKDGSNTTLFIPTVFISYTGQVLDRKTPLLRSMQALNKQAVRVLRAFGNQTSKRVIATMGPEQEYFLIDRELYKKRKDLLLAGRTVYGAPSPKGQELDDHYFGTLSARVATYMETLNRELWKLAVTAKTQHNEVAPAQYELAPVFSTVNIAADHNQLVMEEMKKVAESMGMACLLHEKPFAGVNGSGKHVNWSISTDDGVNLLDPGVTPHQNAQFLVFLCAVIKAVDDYSHLLRASVSSPGNDHRLGANEAPPAIISIFLGEQLSDIIAQLGDGPAKSSKGGGGIKLGVTTLPTLQKDCTDRNRTSPFAFTGNKFEFRMCGSSGTVAAPGFVLNTIVADTLEKIADELEGAINVEQKTQEILQKIVKDHGRVIFDGNNYSQEWVDEAARRGLHNLKNAVEALADGPDETIIEVFERQGVLTGCELEARFETLLEQYVNQINIEAKCALSIGASQIVPAVVTYAQRLSTTIANLKGAGIDVEPYASILAEVSKLLSDLRAGLAELKQAIAAMGALSDVKEKGFACRDQIVPVMKLCREAADALETIVDADLWPLPTYAELLFLK